MANKKIDKQARLGRKILFIYLLGCAFWLVIWQCVGGYGLMTHNVMLWLPFLSCYLILGVNIALWARTRIISYERYEVELRAIQFVETNAGQMVRAITGTLVIAAAILALKDATHLPIGFIVFQSVAFVCAVVGVLPLYWVPSKRIPWLVCLRHIKTVPFTYAISLFLSGLMSLLYWLAS